MSKHIKESLNNVWYQEENLAYMSTFTHFCGKCSKKQKHHNVQLEHFIIRPSLSCLLEQKFD